MPPSPIDPNPSTPARDLDPTPHPSPSRSLIGTPPLDHWLHSASPPTFDLTRPSPPSFPLPSPSTSLTLSTTTTTIILSPPTTALLIIDLQNFFLSTALDRPANSAGNLAAQHLLSTAIPAARKADIRIIWLNWGLTDQELKNMPPATKRAFGFEVSLQREAGMEAAEDAHGVNQAAVEEAQRRKEKRAEKVTENGKPARLYKGLGSEVGPVTLEDGSVVDGGRLLMRDTWNASLPPALLDAYHEGARLENKPDVWIHKNRMSGLWGAGTPCTEFLEKEGLIFSPDVHGLGAYALEMGLAD